MHYLLVFGIVSFSCYSIEAFINVLHRLTVFYELLILFPVTKTRRSYGTLSVAAVTYFALKH